MRKSFVANVVFGLSVAISVFALATTAFATTVNVDITSSLSSLGTYDNTAAAPDSGVIWNGLVAPVGGNVANGTVWNGLVNSNGVTPGVWFGTNVTLTLEAAPLGWNAHDWGGTPPAWAGKLMNDGLYTFNGSEATAVVFTISGLVSGAAYDLYVYSENGFNFTSTTHFKTAGAQKTATNPGSPGLGTVTYLENRNYVFYDDLIATGGSISVLMWSNDGNGASFNGFQLVGVPEPTSVTLLAMGMLGMLAVRRRNRR